MAEPNKPMEPAVGKTTPAEQPPKPKKPKKQFHISQLFFNNRFVLVFSFICAFVMWLGMELTSTENRSRVIYNVPVEVIVSESDSNLTVFSQSLSTVSVVVEGNNVIINRITADDVRVTAVLDHSAQIISGTDNGMTTYQLTLTAQKNGNELADFEVIGCSASTVTVKADVAMETTFNLTDMGTYTVDEDCYVNAPVFSVDTITVAGPRSVVNQIRTVGVRYAVDKALTQTQTLTTGLVCLDEDQGEVNSEYLRFSSDTVDVTFNVYARKTLALKPSFIHMPSDFPQDRISVTPATIEVAGSKEMLENLTELTLDTMLDFTEFTISNTSETVDIVLPKGFRNIDDTVQATITVDLSGYTHGTFTTTQISVKNASSNQYVTLVTGSLEVRVVGPKEDISWLTGNSIYCVVDLTNTNNVFGTMELPVTVEIHNNDSCWVIGSYTVNLQISDTPPGGG